MTSEKKWRVRLTCCGRDDGAYECATREEAEQFREGYTSGPGVNPRGYSAQEHEPGHRRSAVIEAIDDDAILALAHPKPAPPAPAVSIEPAGRSDAVSEADCYDAAFDDAVQVYVANSHDPASVELGRALAAWRQRPERRAATPVPAPAASAGLRRAFNRLLRESQWVREAYELDKDNSLIATDFCAAVKAAEALAADPNARTTP